TGRSGRKRPRTMRPAAAACCSAAGGPPARAWRTWRGPTKPFGPAECSRGCFPAEAQPFLTLVPRLRDEDRVFDAYRQHDLLVCPSTSEGFGMVVVEALSQRLPVVCSQAVGAAELLEDGREALLVPPRQPEALAAALAQLLANPGLRQQLGEAGHQRTRELSWDAIALRTLAAYERALQE